MRLKLPKPPTPKCSKCRRTLLPGSAIPVSLEFISEAREGFHKVAREKPDDPEPAWARNRDVCPTCWEKIQDVFTARKEREKQRAKAKEVTRLENVDLLEYKEWAHIPSRIWRKAPKATRLGWMKLHIQRRANQPDLRCRGARLPQHPAVVTLLRDDLWRRNLAPLLVAWARHPRVLNRYWDIGLELAKKLIRRIQNGLEFLTREEEVLLSQYWGPHIHELNDLVWIPIRGLDIGLGSAYAKGPLGR